MGMALPLILLKNPSGQKVTVKKTISDVSPGNSNRVQTKLARKNSRQFSCIFTHLQKRGVLQQNHLWQLTRSTALVTLTNRPTRGFSVSFSPDGSRLAVGWLDGRVDLWDVPGRRWIRTLTDDQTQHPGHVAFSPSRNLLAATSETNAVSLDDLDSGRQSILWRAPDQDEWFVRDLAFSQDSSRVDSAEKPPATFLDVS
jgi:WD40 repeat protein